ncbi:MAG: aspartate 1-decarboxylase [Pseudomonadota bacterium]
MQYTMLKSKLHHARVTHSELEYEGSCAIDGALLDLAGIHEYEQIQIYNKANGERFTTYAIRAEEGSGMISVNGAAAHKASPGDRVIICTYAMLNQHELANFKPVLVYLDENNLVVRTSNAIPVQVA